jgi:hypothetical protein
MEWASATGAYAGAAPGLIEFIWVVAMNHPAATEIYRMTRSGHPRTELIFVFRCVDPAGGRCEILKEPVGREFSRGSKEVFLVWESTKGILLRNDLCSLSLI